MKSAPALSPDLHEPAEKAAALSRFPLLAAIFVDCPKRVLLGVSVAAMTLYALMYIVLVYSSERYATGSGGVIGGDFIVFWTTAKAVLAGGATALYESAQMSAALVENFPARDHYNLFWQYPPAMFFIVAPLGVLPYLPAHWLWGLGTASALAAVLRGIWRRKSALIVAFASAAAYQGFITGQTGFFTAALITLAAGWADRKPVLAGLAAGLLTVKPQMGLLIPFAFAAAGCWRAFAVAAATGAGLAGLSLLVFGADAWVAFYEAAAAHGGRMSQGVFPFHKLISPFGGLMTLGAPTALAMSVQGLTTLSLAGFVFLVWRRTGAWELRLMALVAAAPLASPYAFYYELPILIAPLLLLARRGLETGWLKGEKQALMALWSAPLFLPGSESLPLAPMIALGAFALCARRVLTECGGGQSRYSASYKTPAASIPHALSAGPSR